MSEGYSDSVFIKEDSRSNFKDVVAKRPDLLKKDGGRIKFAGAGLVVEYKAGLVLGYATSGADSGKYKPYNDANTDGSQVAVGLLESTTQVDDAGNGSEIAIMRGGIFFEDMLIGLDANGKADLGAKSFVEHGVNLISF